MTSKFLLLFKPFQRFTFEVKKPERKISFKVKLAWTFGILVLYLAMLSIPIVGVKAEQGSDPFFAMRAILASQRGSLAELGIGPIVTAGLIMQLLVGSQIIKVDFTNPEERALYTGTQKVLAVLMTLFESLAYILGGAYGEDLSFQTQMIILLQLIVAGIIIMLMDELIQKGYGLGSGISLFIAASVSFHIFDGMFNTAQDSVGDVMWFRGCILALFQGIARGDLKTPFLRPGRTPDLLGLIATIVVFGMVIYVDSIKIEIPVQHSQFKMPARYPIKFLYTSNIPVILVSALFANIYFISNLMYNKWDPNDPGIRGFLVRLFGTWDTIEGGGNQMVPVTGLAAFTTAPYGPEQIAQQPWHSLTYFVLMVVLCGAFSRIWIDTAGMSARNVAKQLLDANMQIPGFRRNPKIIEQYLNQYIPIAAWLGGFFIGVLAAVADFLGALGTGTGILLTTGILRQYYEIFASEQIKQTMPALAGFLGLE